MNRTILTVTGVLSASSLLLVDSAVKGTVLLALAAVAALMLRRDSAATRHLVWLLAMVAILVVPVLSAVLPQWRVLPAWMSSPRPAVAEVGSPAIIRPAEVAVELPQASALVEVERPAATDFQPATAPPVSQPAVVAPAEVSAPMAWSWNWINALPLVWAIGFAVLMLRLSAARWMLWNSERLATVIWPPARGVGFQPADDREKTSGRLEACPAAQDPIVAAMKAICSQLGISRPVTLLIHPNKTIPVVWGILRCRLMLPAAARQWSDEQLQSVLLHELAHVTRRDTIVQLLAQVACALHWFNPLVWFAAWRLDLERERSCDDMVLASGIRPSAYAAHLLDVLSGLSPARWTQACGLAMARKSSLEGRLTAVLGKDLNRRDVSLAIAGLALAIAVGVAVPIAMLRAADEKWNPPQSAHVGSNDFSTYCVHDGKEASFVIVYHGDLDSATESDSNPKTRTWTNAGTLTARKPGIVLTFHRTHTDPGKLRITTAPAEGRDLSQPAPPPRTFGHKDYDLAKGRAFVLSDSGDVRQLDIAVPVVTDHTSAKKFATLIAAISPTLSNVDRDKRLTAWGNEVGGLQAGLGFKAGEQRAYTHGESVSLVVRVRNVSKQEIKFQYYPMFLSENSPTALDEKGKPVSLPGNILHLVKRELLKEVTLAAGKEIELYERKLNLASGNETKVEGQPDTRDIFPTGKFQLHYEKVFGKSAQGFDKIDLALEKLATGKLELEVIKAEAAWSTWQAGNWPMPGGVTLEVKQDLVHASDISSTAILTWPIDAAGGTARHSIRLGGDAFAACQPWRLAWERGATVLWTISGEMQSSQDFHKVPATPRFLRRIDFSDPEKITQSIWGYVPEFVPEAIRAEFAKGFLPLRTTPRTPDQAQPSVVTSRAEDVRPVAELLNGEWRSAKGDLDVQIIFPARPAEEVKWTITFERPRGNVTVRESLTRLDGPLDATVLLTKPRRATLGKLRRGIGDTLLHDIMPHKDFPEYEQAHEIVLRRVSAPNQQQESQAKEKDPFTAWGTEVGGLQAGLGFKPGEQRAFTHGETVTLVVRVRNVGQKELHFHYDSENFLEKYPSVTDATGKPVPQHGIDTGGLIPLTKKLRFDRVNLAPDQECDLGEASLKLRPNTEEVANASTADLFGTGKVRIQYERLFLNTANGGPRNDPDLSTLATGKLELVVQEVPAKNDGTPAADEQNLRHEKRLQGTWQVVEAHVGGTHAPRESSKEQVWKFDRDKLVFDFGDGDPMEMTYRIDEKQEPATIDLSPLGPREKGNLYKGIYELDGDQLKVHFTRNSAANSRPAKFEPNGIDRGMRYFVLKRTPIPVVSPEEKQGTDAAAPFRDKLAELDAKIAALKMERVKLSGRLAAKHPNIRKLDTELEALEEARAGFVATNPQALSPTPPAASKPLLPPPVANPASVAKPLPEFVFARRDWSRSAKVAVANGVTVAIHEEVINRADIMATARIRYTAADGTVTGHDLFIASDVSGSRAKWAYGWERGTKTFWYCSVSPDNSYSLHRVSFADPQRIMDDYQQYYPGEEPRRTLGVPDAFYAQLVDVLGFQKWTVVDKSNGLPEISGQNVVSAQPMTPAGIPVKAATILPRSKDKRWQVKFVDAATGQPVLRLRATVSSRTADGSRTIHVTRVSSNGTFEPMIGGDEYAWVSVEDENLTNAEAGERLFGNVPAGISAEEKHTNPDAPFIVKVKPRAKQAAVGAVIPSNQSQETSPLSTHQSKTPTHRTTASWHLLFLWAALCWLFSSVSWREHAATTRRCGPTCSLRPLRSQPLSSAGVFAASIWAARAPLPPAFFWFCHLVCWHDAG